MSDFESGYQTGGDMARLEMLRILLRNIDVSPATWAVQYLELRACLRRVCAEYGDNEWPDDLSLVDVIEKHLVPHLT